MMMGMTKSLNLMTPKDMFIPQTFSNSIKKKTKVNGTYFRYIGMFAYMHNTE
jgi:hypothetical protein